MRIPARAFVVIGLFNAALGAGFTQLIWTALRTVSKVKITYRLLSGEVR